MLSPNRIESPSLRARRGRESDIGITPNLNPDGFPIHSVFTCLPTDGFFMHPLWLLLRPPLGPRRFLYTPPRRFLPHSLLYRAATGEERKYIFPLFFRLLTM